MTQTAPERIWVDYSPYTETYQSIDHEPDGYSTEYARADLLTAHEATIAALVAVITDRLHSEDCDCGACLPLRAALAAAKGS